MNICLMAYQLYEAMLCGMSYRFAKRKEIEYQIEFTRVRMRCERYGIMESCIVSLESHLAAFSKNADLLGQNGADPQYRAVLTLNMDDIEEHILLLINRCYFAAKKMKKTRRRSRHLC